MDHYGGMGIRLEPHVDAVRRRAVPSECIALLVFAVLRGFNTLAFSAFLGAVSLSTSFVFMFYIHMSVKFLKSKTTLPHILPVFLVFI